MDYSWPPHSQRLTYLSGIRTVKISAHSPNSDADEDRYTFEIELVNSTHRTISFDKISYYGKYPSDFSHQGFMDVLGSIETDSIETLCFYHCPVHTHHTLPQVTPEYVTQGLRKFQNLKTLILMDCNITLFHDCLSSCPIVDTLVVYSAHLDHTTIVDIVRRVEELAVSRQRAGSPLRALTLVFPFAGPRPLELERLTSCVGRVEVLSGREAVCWDVDKYLLGATTHKDNASGL